MDAHLVVGGLGDEALAVVVLEDAGLVAVEAF